MARLQRNGCSFFRQSVPEMLAVDDWWVIAIRHRGYCSATLSALGLLFWGGDALIQARIPDVEQCGFQGSRD